VLYSQILTPCGIFSKAIQDDEENVVAALTRATQSLEKH